MHERHGAKQPQRFDPARAARLDDPERFRYLPVEEIIALSEPAKGSTVLDFGAGTGAYAIAMAKVRPDLHIVAFDEQPEMIEFLQTKLAREPLHNVEPLLGDRISGTYDRIVAINVLHEVGDDALAGIRDALTDQGRVLFVDWNAETERPVGPPGDHVYSIAEARARLRRSGFAITAEETLAYHYALLARRAAGR